MRYEVIVRLASPCFGAAGTGIRRTATSRNYRRIRPRTRYFSTTSSLAAGTTQDGGKEVDIAILGGGISGLSTAFYLLAWHQRAFTGRTPKITIYEGSNRVGGWIRTTKKGDSSAYWLFEHGPRTLRVRPESMLLQLLKTLGLESKVRFTSKQSPSAQNRYLYQGGSSPEELGLVPNSGSLRSWDDTWRLFGYMYPVIRHGLANFFRKFPPREQVLANQAPGEEDMSLGELMSWILGRKFVDKVMSAMAHGIYGADIYKLSAREVLADKANLFEAYADGDVTSLREFLRSGQLELYLDGPLGRYDPQSTPFFRNLVENDRLGIPSADFKVLAGQILDADDPHWAEFRPIAPDTPRPGGKFLNDMARASAFATLEGGLETLTQQLASQLLMSGVNIQLNTQITGLVSNNGKVAAQTSQNPKPQSHDYIISTLDPTALSHANIASPAFAKVSPSLSMGVGTVLFRQRELIGENQAFYNVANSAFGYLIPAAYSNPDTNPYDAMGVVFDSGMSSMAEIEPYFAKLKQEAPDRAYAKATVISGGRFWQDSDPKEKSDSLFGDNLPQSKRDKYQAQLHSDWLVGNAYGTLNRQLSAPVPRQMREQGILYHSSGDQGDVCDSAGFLAPNSIVQHGVGHFAAWRRETQELEKKFGANKVWLSGRAAHSNGISQCIDGAVQAAAKVLMEGYGIGKLEEVIRRIRTPPKTGPMGPLSPMGPSR